MQGQLVDLRDAYKVIRKALFVKQGQGNEWRKSNMEAGQFLVLLLSFCALALHIKNRRRKG